MSAYFVEAELIPVRDVDQRLVEIDDWKLLLALHNDIRGWDGLITNDAKMLKLPREMCVLEKTRPKLVVAEAAGHDPLKATGLLLAHLPQICCRLDPARPEIWRLRVSSKNPETPMSFIRSLALRRKQSPGEFLKQNGLSDLDLGTDLFS